MTAQDEWTADEKLINRAAVDLDLMIQTSAWHPSECLRRVFVPILAQVRADVKAACPSIPPTPEGDYRAEWGPEHDRRTLELSPMDDGGLFVEAEDRDERVTLYLEAEDVARLRGWLR